MSLFEKAILRMIRLAALAGGGLASRRRDPPADAVPEASDVPGRRAAARPFEIEAPPIRADGLQLDENRAGQERFWTAERVVHGLYGVVVLIALAGLTGSGGPLSRTTAGTDAGTVEYPRIIRWETPDDLSVTFAAARPSHRLTLTNVFSEGLVIDSIQPAPVTTVTGPDSLALEFAATPAASVSASIRLRASRPGLVRLRAQLDGGPPSPVPMIVLP